MRSIGLLVIVLLKVAILFLYVNFQDTILMDIDGAYRFLFYLIACGSCLLVLGLTWRKANIIELHWWSQFLVVPLIIIVPPTLVSLYFATASIEAVLRPFQDLSGFVVFVASELFVFVVAYALLKLVWRRRIQTS